MGCNLFQGKKERGTRNSPLFSLILRCFLQKESEKGTPVFGSLPPNVQIMQEQGEFSHSIRDWGRRKKDKFPPCPGRDEG